MSIHSVKPVCQECPYVAAPVQTRRSFAGRLVEGLESAGNAVIKAAKLAAVVALLILFSPLILAVYLAGGFGNRSYTDRTGSDSVFYGLAVPILLVAFLFGSRGLFN